jgi:hypothetical protein
VPRQDDDRLDILQRAGERPRSQQARTGPPSRLRSIPRTVPTRGCSRPSRRPCPGSRGRVLRYRSPRRGEPPADLGTPRAGQPDGRSIFRRRATFKKVQELCSHVAKAGTLAPNRSVAARQAWSLRFRVCSTRRTCLPGTPTRSITGPSELDDAGGGKPSRASAPRTGRGSRSSSCHAKLRKHSPASDAGGPAPRRAA